MKCVKDAGCIEDSCGHVVRLQTCLVHRALLLDYSRL